MNAHSFQIPRLGREYMELHRNTVWVNAAKHEESETE